MDSRGKGGAKVNGGDRELEKGRRYCRKEGRGKVTRKRELRAKEEVSELKGKCRGDKNGSARLHTLCFSRYTDHLDLWTQNGWSDLNSRERGGGGRGRGINERITWS